MFTLFTLFTLFSLFYPAKAHLTPTFSKLAYILMRWLLRCLLRCFLR
jgi:hypothetical protein